MPLDDWKDTKLRLHLMCQVIGKTKLALMPRKNHWWNITLHINSQGLTSGPVPFKNRLENFEVQLNLKKHQAEITSSTGDEHQLELRGGLSVADFYRWLMDSLTKMKIEVETLDKPYDMPIDKGFGELTEYQHYDTDAIGKYWQIMRWTHNVFTDFSGRFYGKTCPVHLYWHSFDLVVTRFNGKKAPPMPAQARISDKDAYSHENISFGFWPGDDKLPEPAYYSYTYPAPAGIDKAKLKPSAGFWMEQNGSPMALLKYHELIEEADPRQALLSFMESAYLAGAQSAGWPVDELRVPPLADL